MSDLDFPGEVVGGEDFGGSPADRPTGYAGIPDIQKPQLVEPREEPFSREAAVGVGSMVGGLTGGTLAAGTAAPTGPGAILAAYGGSAAGGALGAAGGSFAYDASNRLYQVINDGPTDTPGEYLSRASRHALREAGYDFALSTGAGAVGKVLGDAGKKTAALMLGMGKEEAKQAAQSAAQGVDVGITHVSRFNTVRGLSRILGVFPLVGKGYLEGQKRIVGQIDEKAADLLNTIAPKSNQFDVSGEILSSAQKKYDKFVNIKGALYDKFFQLADNATVPDVVPMEGVREALSDIVTGLEKEKITLAGGETMERLKNTDVAMFMSQVAELPDYLTVRQARGLQRELNELARTAKIQGHDVSSLSSFKDAITDAIQNLDTSRMPPDEAAAISDALNKANEFFHSGKKIFETKTAKKLGRFESRMFEPGVSKPGTINVDDIYRTVVEVGNPTALHDLRKLVGKKTFNRVVRQRLQDAFDASIIPSREGGLKDDLFSAQRFEDKMRLNTEEGWASMKELLKGTGVDYRQWAKFLNAAKTGTDIVIREPSQFVMRRMILAGFSTSALAGSMFVGAGQISIPVAGLLTWLTRKAGFKFMDPVFLRDVTAVASESVPEIQKRNAFARIMHAVPKSETPGGSDDRTKETHGDGYAKE